MTFTVFSRTLEISGGGYFYGENHDLHHKSDNGWSRENSDANDLVETLGTLKQSF